MCDGSEWHTSSTRRVEIEIAFVVANDREEE